MSEIETYNSETLEHLGLVAGMFDELGIGDLVDELLPQDLSQRKVSIAQALKAMVLRTAWAWPTGACSWCPSSSATNPPSGWWTPG